MTDREKRRTSEEFRSDPGAADGAVGEDRDDAVPAQYAEQRHELRRGHERRAEGAAEIAIQQLEELWRDRLRHDGDLQAVRRDADRADKWQRTEVRRGDDNAAFGASTLEVRIPIHDDPVASGIATHLREPHGREVVASLVDERAPDEDLPLAARQARDDYLKVRADGRASVRCRRVGDAAKATREQRVD